MAPGQPIISRIQQASELSLVAISPQLASNRHHLAPSLFTSPTSPLPLRPPNKQPPNNTRSNSQPTHNRNPKQPLLLHLILDQILQTLRLQVPLLQLQQAVIIPPGLGVVSQFVVA
jgi:hypothetical protein